jgi:crotonobetainyl-CoA:carnitine CoA-transferase CaiB-like acyl-CoA transferase
VLDATRILAGPFCGRVLAEHGADVLLVTSPALPDFEQSVMDTGHGKRSAHLDLRTGDGRERFSGLVAEADVVVQSYRGGSFARHGLGPEDLAAVRPGLVHVSISCYGQDGPWADRPGWEHLAQTAAGLAVGHGGSERPRLMPVAFCDYVTGYLAALGVAEALRRRAREGGTWAVEASLAHTATWLEGRGAVVAGDPSGLGDLDPLTIEGASPFGWLRAVAPALRLDGRLHQWPRLAVPLGTDPLAWAGEPSS